MRHTIGLRVAMISAVLGSAVLVPVAQAGTSTGPPPQIRYAKVRQACHPKRPHGARCMSLRLVPARANTPGAHAYVVAAGARSKGPAGGLTPADLASAYAYEPAEGGSGQTVAVVDAFDDPNIEADLGTFDSHYGLPACTTANGCFTKVDEDGSTSAFPEGEAGWGVEISLDVETVHSVCPDCKIVLVEANTEEISDLSASVNEAVARGATEISNSYGLPESVWGATELSAYEHPGIVVTASSGDSGYYDWDFAFELGEPPGEPNAPASLPDVVAVGGTSLKLSAKGVRKSETVWNDNGAPEGGVFKHFKQPTATGSGCSKRFAAPAWQLGVAGWEATGCETHRLDNDVSAVADPYTGFDIYDSYGSEIEPAPGWATIGGTSLSSPLIASLYALAGGSHGVNFPAETLYEHAGQGGELYDVTQGGSGYCDGEATGPCGEPNANEELGEVDCLGTSACDATSGFDGPSGVGAPVGLVALGGPNESKAEVLTERASLVTTSSAQLNASVNPGGATVSACSFEYGTTKAFGESVTCASLPAGTSPEPVSASLSGLPERTKYFFRISVTTPGGTSVGKTKAFKTKKTRT